MPEIDPTRSLSFIVLCEETTPVEVASYAVNITLTDVDGNAKTIATYRYPTNIVFDYAFIKNSVDDLTVMRAATKQSVSLDMFESYAITWPEEVAIIQNSFTDPNISIIYSCGDNIYNAGFVQVGGIAGLNTGKLINCVSTEFMFNYTVNNITLDKQNISFTPMENATDGKYYYVYADYNNQTGNYDTRYVVYLDENVTLHNVSEYDEYTMEEYKASYPQVAGKFAMFDSVAVFIETAVDADAGSKTSVGIATAVGAGEIDELPLACGFNKLRWQYLSILEANIYK